LFSSVFAVYGFLKQVKKIGFFVCFRFFYASSACIYPEFKQLETTNVSLKESDAWPAEVCDYFLYVLAKDL